jgi:cob(I)alamin adenosyltransferase
MPKIYTKTGDKGKSSLWGGKRVSKASSRIEAYGTVDELNSILGIVYALDSLDKTIKKSIQKIQKELIIIGSDLATPIDISGKFKQVRISKSPTTRLEKEIDKLSKILPRLSSFILPTGSFEGSVLHHARAVCRRAERNCVKLSNEEDINENVIVYLNRLSDWLFTAARYQNMKDNKIEVKV